LIVIQKYLFSVLKEEKLPNELWYASCGKMI
jgi:hypothetical protein